MQLMRLLHRSIYRAICRSNIRKKSVVICLVDCLPLYGSPIEPPSKKNQHRRTQCLALPSAPVPDPSFPKISIGGQTAARAASLTRMMV